MPETVEMTDGGIVENTSAMRIIISGYYDTLDALAAAHPTGIAGDCYKVGDNLYAWGPTVNTWIDIGRLKGETGNMGPAGADGIAATITIGVVATGAAGTEAIVSNAGTSSAAVLNFTIPKGSDGQKGDTGPAGADGGRWYTGTGITGESTAEGVFASSGVADAVAGDMYLNSSTWNVYRCTAAGAAVVARWVYICNIKGETGPMPQLTDSLTEDDGSIALSARGGKLLHDMITSLESGETDIRGIIATLQSDLDAKTTNVDAATLAGQAQDYYRCANGCSWTCSSGCTGGCLNGCTGGCLAGCTGGCSSCTGSCTGSCSTTCTGGCTGCTGTCSGGCSGCSNTCSGSCTSCTGSCSGSCSTTCTGTCTVTCTKVCNNACSNQCKGNN